jgi:hypothetical protein
MPPGPGSTRRSRTMVNGAAARPSTATGTPFGTAPLV